MPPQASIADGETRPKAGFLEASSSERRLPQLPDVPTFKEQGLPEYEAYTWHMALMPRDTPAVVVRQLNGVIDGVLAEPAMQKRLEDLAMQVRTDSTPESTTQWLQAEMAKWEPIIREAGIKSD